MMVTPQTLKEKLAQLVFVRIGSNMPPPRTVDDDAERISRLLERLPIGGLCLFNGHGNHTDETLQKLQEQSRFPLLVGSDMERGLGQQLKSGTAFPHARAFGALGSKAVETVEEYARIGAREALSSGIHIAFAPVADVSRNPKNPIIATRAFGEDPETVANLVSAFVRGCRAEGLLSTAKHFPGHGNTESDSHDGLPLVVSDREELHRFDLPPFEAAINEGVELIMTAHVAYSGLDRADVPATASSRILIDLLRNQLGFEGAVISDSLLMEGIAGTGISVGESAARLINAGVDILLDVHDAEATVSGLIAEVERGALTLQRVDEAFSRVWKLKSDLLGRFGNSFFTNPTKSVHVAPAEYRQHEQFALKIAMESATQQNSPAGNPASDVTADDKILALFIKPFQTPLDPDEQPLAAALRSAHLDVTYLELGPGTTPEEYQDVMDSAERYTRILVAAVVKPAAWHKFGLSAEQRIFVNNLCLKTEVTLASLGSPLLFEQCPHSARQICLYSDMLPSQCALASLFLNNKITD